MKFKIIITIFLCFILFFGSSIYRHIQGPIESELAVRQLEDSITGYALARAIARDELILNLIRFICIGLLLAIWTITIVKKMKGVFPNEKANSDHIV